MSLPETNISVTLVKNAIGSSSTGVANLVQSELVNQWGFNSPLGVQQGRYWGIFPRTAPHELGAFRGYDHRWRCYSTDAAVIDSGLSNYETGNVTYKIGYFPSESDVGATAAHVFDVLFNRANDFTHSTHTQLQNDVVINDNGQLAISIDPFYPPDGGAALTPNTSIYLKVIHVSSPARRWDKRMFAAADTADDSYTIKVDIGADVFTYVTTFQIQSAGSTKVWRQLSNGGLHSYLTLFNANKYDVTVNMTFEINNYSGFDGLISDSVTGDFVVPAGTRSGSTLIKGTSNVELFRTGSMTKWSVGVNFYGRVRINSATTGGFSSAWQTGFDGIVTNTPPL